MNLLNNKQAKPQQDYIDQYGVTKDCRTMSLAEIAHEFPNGRFIIFNIDYIKQLYNDGVYHPLELYCPVEVCASHTMLDEDNENLWEVISANIEGYLGSLNPSSFGNDVVKDIEKTVVEIEMSLALFSDHMKRQYSNQFLPSMSSNEAVVYSDVADTGKLVVVVEKL